MTKKLKRLFAATFNTDYVHGNLFNIFAFGVGCFYIWHAEDVGIWFDMVVLGRDSYHAQLLSEGQLRARRVFAVALFLAGTSISVANLFFLTKDKLHRRKAKKSAQGQWYDTDSLTKEDLYADKDVDDESK